MPDRKQEKHRWWLPIVAGSVAGGVGYVGTMPLDYVKQRLQTDRNISLQSIRKNGFKSLFRGGLVGCTSIVPQMTLKFTVNDYLRRKTSNSAFANGFLAGYVDGSFLGPLLSLQSLKQMRNDYTYRDALKSVWAAKPVNLTLPLALRNGVYTSVMFGGHNKANVEPSFVNNLLLGSALNIPATIAASPFDVLRAKQIQRMLEQQSTGTLAIAGALYRERGVRAFYQGFGSLYINFALRFPFTFALYRLMIDWEARSRSHR